jgi:2-polyprenyl-3-methyl-5-hydroxy-6-metoxy-1,4-benzoquinol methylase
MLQESTRLRTGLRYTICHLCGSDDTRLLFQLPVPEHHKDHYALNTWNIVRCNRCGLIYENPQPDEQSLRKFYTFETHEDRRFVDSWFIGEAEHMHTIWRRYLAAMSKYIRQGELLDVGCGAGSFLVEAQKQGFSVAGQDIADFFVQYCWRTYGIKIFACAIEELAQSRQSYFDVITAFDMIEHHPQPKQLLQTIRGMIKPGGIVAISTHNVGNIFAKRYGSKWRHFHFAHLTYFDRRTLTNLLEQTGFQVLKFGGLHTIDSSNAKEYRNYIFQFFKVIFLRFLILKTYMPIMKQFPRLTRWQLKLGRQTLNHERLVVRVGNQVILNDDMLLIARAV